MRGSVIRRGDVYYVKIELDPDPATGKRIWVFEPELDQAITSRSFFAHTRGIAIGDGRVYVGTADGRLMAVDEKNGQLMWEKRLVNSAKDTAGFSGAGTFVNSDLLVIGQNGGEYPIEGRVFGVNPKDGTVKWTFYTTGRDDPEALATTLRDEGFIKKGITVDPSLVADYLAPFAEPTRVERFRFSREWMRTQFERINNPRDPSFTIATKLNLPPSYLLIHRTWLGGIGLLSQLEAEAPFRAILEESLPGFADD